MTISYEYDGNLYLNLTNRCPNSCDFCLRNNSEGSLYSKNLWLEREPSAKEVLEDIKKRDLSKYKQIVFCGYGEPTSRWDDLILVSKEIKKLGNYEIRLNTNGQAMLITGRNCVEDAKGLIDVVSISLNGSTAQKYQEICHSDFGLKAFDSMLEFTKECVEIIPKVYMTVVDTMDKEEIEACKTVCEKTGAIFRIRTYIDK